MKKIKRKVIPESAGSPGVLEMAVPDFRKEIEEKLADADLPEELKEELQKELERIDALNDKANRFDLDPHLVKLMLDEPFFGSVSKHVMKHRSLRLPTAGVYVGRGTQLNLAWNPLFFVGMSDREIQGVLKHEFYHIIFDHITTRRRAEAKLWNYATDLAINSLLPRDELPGFCLVPGEFTPLTPAQKKKARPEDIEAYEKLGELIRSMPKGESSDFYYTQLMQSDAAKKVCQPGFGQPKPGEGEGEGGTPGEGENVFQGQFDDHDGWDKMTAEEREIMKGKMKEALRQAVRDADSKNKWGNIPMEIQEEIRRLVSNQVDWKALLRSFVGMTHNDRKTTSMKRINRRYPLVHPGYKRHRIANLAIAIDMSGSVDDESLALFFGELNQLAKRVTFTVIPFDHSVDEENIFEWRRGQKKPAIRTRSGGTNFQAPTDYVNDRTDRFDGMLILTDGECGEPGPARVKRGWVICPGRKLLFDTNETLIQMVREAKRT